jgi:hypothetical protein
VNGLYVSISDTNGPTKPNVILCHFLKSPLNAPVGLYLYGCTSVPLNVGDCEGEAEGIADGMKDG